MKHRMQVKNRELQAWREIRSRGNRYDKMFAITRHGSQEAGDAACPPSWLAWRKMGLGLGLHDAKVVNARRIDDGFAFEFHGQLGIQASDMEERSIWIFFEGRAQTRWTVPAGGEYGEMWPLPKPLKKGAKSWRMRLSRAEHCFPSKGFLRRGNTFVPSSQLFGGSLSNGWFEEAGGRPVLRLENWGWQGILSADRIRIFEGGEGFATKEAEFLLNDLAENEQPGETFEAKEKRAPTRL